MHVLTYLSNRSEVLLIRASLNWRAPSPVMRLPDKLDVTAEKKEERLKITDATFLFSTLPAPSSSSFWTYNPV